MLDSNRSMITNILYKIMYIFLLQKFKRLSEYGVNNAGSVHNLEHSIYITETGHRSGQRVLRDFTPSLGPYSQCYNASEKNKWYIRRLKHLKYCKLCIQRLSQLGSPKPTNPQMETMGDK